MLAVPAHEFSGSASRGSGTRNEVLVSEVFIPVSPVALGLVEKIPPLASPIAPTTNEILVSEVEIYAAAQGWSYAGNVHGSLRECWIQ